jgi:hypothetical protein
MVLLNGRSLDPMETTPFGLLSVSVYVYVCICMYVCVTQRSLSRPYGDHTIWVALCKYVCLYMCVYACMYVLLNGRSLDHMETTPFGLLSVSMYVYVCICMYVCVTQRSVSGPYGNHTLRLVLCKYV